MSEDEMEIHHAHYPVHILLVYTFYRGVQSKLDSRDYLVVFEFAKFPAKN